MGKRKNILLLLSDQQRLDTVSAYGMDCICRTPHIDRLAEEGMKFRNAFCTSAICAPSRASVMTGLYAHRHGVIDNYTDIKEGVPLLGGLYGFCRVLLRLCGKVACITGENTGGMRF